MYPANYFSMFPAFPRGHKVFVAMSFASQFDKRWNNVIVPAIGRMEIDGKPLEPYRVDVRKVSDSILTEILTGISQARLVFADITTEGRLGDIPIRNGNVMYEVGIAHSVRLPEEVLLFRSDSDPLLFDVANIRVNRYSPDSDFAEAISVVGISIMQSLQEVDLKKNLAVISAADSLDYSSWLVLAQAATETIAPPQMRTMGQALGNAARVAAIQRLLDINALSTSYSQLSPDIIKKQIDQPGELLLTYRITPFGKAVLEHVANKMGFLAPEVRQMIEKSLET